MNTAFSTALSALNATSTAIDVVGNNLANLNTTGFKASEVSFYDLMTQPSGGAFNGTQVGLGTAPPITVAQFAQGSVQPTSGPLDAAIQGNGFFMVTNSTNQTLYTRAGNFTLDAQGNLVTATGENVQGWTASNGVINTAGAPSSIQIPAGQLLAPTATTQFSLAMNLDASATAGAATGTFSSPIQAVDSLGNTVNMTVTFTKDPTTPNQWTYQVTVPGDTTTAGTAGTPTSLLTTPGTLTFDSNGNLTSPALANGQIPIAITGLSDSAADMNINFSVYDTNGNSLITQYSQPSAVSASKQDGQTASELTSVGMSNGGLITATYSNGTQLTVAQLAVASIQNPGSLAQVGNNDYAATGQTGQPAIGTADTGGRGQIIGQSLEASNADIATEFTNLITYQRSYEANSKVVTTEDQLTQDTIGLLPAA